MKKKEVLLSAIMLGSLQLGPSMALANETVDSNHPVLKQVIQEKLMIAEGDKCHDRVIIGPVEYSRSRNC